MNKDKPVSEIWWLDLPKTYFEDLSDRGLKLSHPDDAPDLRAFSGNWAQYDDINIYSSEIFHRSLTLRNINGNTKRIHIPKGKGRFECFRDFSQYPDLSYYPSVFEANKRLICYCHGSDNWDGLLHSSIVTIDLDSGKFYNQYWFENWLEKMRQEIPGIEGDVDMWSNGGLQLYLDVEETKLLIHGDYSGEYPASLLFEWKGSRWELIDVIPGPYPSFSQKIGHKFRTFRIGNNSLTRRFTGR